MTSASGAAPSGDAVAAPAVAAFDLDGTLTNGGSVWSFLCSAGGMRRTVVATLRLLPWLAVGALAGGRRADRAKEALFRHALGGLDAQDVAGRAAVFGHAHLARHLRADVAQRLELHRRLGHRIVVVSASPLLYVAPMADELGAEGVLATALEVGPDGKLTGSYDGGNCRGAQKLSRLAAWVESHAPGAQVWAYGNSRGDRRMLHGATVGVNVGRLGRLGRLRAFPRLCQVTPES
ncbi:MAG: HAD family hydrolase [Acidimicrobiales bacterium]